MKDEKLRQALAEYDAEIKILDDHAYDRSIIGIADGGRLIYDYDKMVGELMEDEGWTYEDAAEWVEYNTLRALPYMGDGAPIVMVTDIRGLFWE